MIKIGRKKISLKNPTYFIADIAANHDGSLIRAKKLIKLAAKAGADAAKFQHFSAKTIVSDKGFKSLGKKSSHQKNWGKSVYEVYKDASINLGWTKELKKACDAAGIHFFSSPYSFEMVNHLDKFEVMSQGLFKTKVIIRTSIGSQRPLHPQHQHVGDFTEAFKKVLSTVDIIRLEEPKDVKPAYKKALERNDGKSTILVEYGDYYNEK